MAELLIILLIFAWVTSCPDLDLWLLDHELVWYLGNHVDKLCTKTDQSLAELFMIYYWFFAIFRGCFKTRIGVLKGAWTNLYQIWPGHRCTPSLKMVEICCSVSKPQRLKLSIVERQGQKLHFLTPVTIRGGLGDDSRKNSSIHYDRTCGLHMTGGRCKDCQGERPGKKMKKYSSIHWGFPTYHVERRNYDSSA